MDAEVSFNQLKEVKNVCLESLKKDLSESCFAMEEDTNHLKVPSSQQVVSIYQEEALVPVTPDSNRESEDLRLDFTSPLTVIISPSKPRCPCSQQNDDMCSPDDDSPHTPETGVFDPFAPGPGKLMLAPYRKKILDKPQSYVARRLEFDSFSSTDQDGNCEGDSESVSEEMFVETTYRMLLELVFSKQLEGFVGHVLPHEDGSDGFKTPSVPLNCVADTYPGAPIKPTRKLRNIDPELCRKLEF